MMFYVFWRFIVFTVWFGVMFAICTVAIAVALVAIIGAVVYGLASPTRTPASCLRSLAAHTEAAIAQVRALRPTT